MSNVKTHHPILTTSITAAADLDSKHRFIGFDGDYCAAAARALGTLEVETDAGHQAPVNVLGIVLVEAGAAIDAGAAVEADADARAVTLDAGVSNGVAIDAAAAAGDIIRIVRGI